MSVLRESWSLFEEPYWLDCVAPGAWDVLEVKDEQGVVGRMPFVAHSYAGIRRLSTPPLTPWLGPWVRSDASNAGKSSDRLSLQHQTLAELLKQLPACHSALIPCAPEYTNMMAFHWAGFEIGLRYTYRFDDLTDLEALWNNMIKKRRYECRAAEKKLAVSSESDIRQLIACVEMTFERQEMDRKSLYPVLERIEEEMSRRGQSRMYFARDAQERLHAAVYIVFDDRCAFYLMGGADPALRSSGAQSLLLWHAIREHAKTSQKFDFEGSMIPAVERFNRTFSPRQTPRYFARKDSLLYSAIERVRRLRRR